VHGGPNAADGTCARAFFSRAAVLSQAANIESECHCRKCSLFLKSYP
jgi:hypothetical protein